MSITILDERNLETLATKAYVDSKLKDLAGIPNNPDDSGNSGNTDNPNVDLSGYYTKEEIDEMIDEAISNVELTPGPPGEPGRTPVKGVDYFTDEEKTEMVNSVLSEMPTTPSITINGQGPDENGNFIVDSRTQEAVTVNGVTGLGIADGATIPAGISLDDFVKMVVQKAIPASYTKPTLSIANNGGQASGNVEAGSTITPKLKATFTKNDAGNLTSIDIKKGSTSVANGTTSPLTYSGSSIVIGDETITFSATAAYGDAPVKQNNLGQDSKENWFAGSTVISGDYSITGKRNMFYGTGVGAVPTVTSDMVRDLDNTKLAPTNGTSVNINVAVGQQYIVFAYPAGLRDVNNVTYVEANDSGMASSFTKTTIDVADARGGKNGMKSYKVYTYAMAVPAAAAMTFKVTI